MAVIKFTRMEGSDFKFSGLNKDTDYTNNPLNVYYSDVQDPTVLFSFTGKNYSDFLWNLELDKEVDLITFKTGERIAIQSTVRYTEEYGATHLYHKSQDLKFLFYDANGVSKLFSSFGSLDLGWGKSLDSMCDGNIYFSVAIDDVTQYGYLMMIKTSLTDGTGSFSNRKPGTAITECSGNSYKLKQTFYRLFTGEGIEYDPDPWANAGYAGIGGGEGVFDFTSDIVGLPPIPSIDATSTGFLQLYKGTLQQVRALASYLWTDDFLTNLVKVTQDPLDIIMSLYMYPFHIPTTTTRIVRAGNVETGVSMGVPERQILEIDCGNFPVPSFYGTYLDYEPFTKCEIILPYCSTYNISLDDVSGKEVNVRYRVDLLTGSCAAYIIVDGSVRYTFTGMCAINIPITSQSFINNYASLLSLVGVGASALSNPTIAAASDVAANVMQCKPNISKGGSVASNVGFMSLQKPCFIFTVPRVAIPKGLAKHNGYPIFATYKLSELSGYTEIETILVSDFGRATKEEVDEIEKLLKGGVIL